MVNIEKCIELYDSGLDVRQVAKVLSKRIGSVSKCLKDNYPGFPKPPKKRTLLKDRFEAKVMPEPNTGCWFWLGYIDQHGYGTLKNDGYVQKAHRISYKLYKGKIPFNLLVCHHCDNPSCVNPDHLFLGTQTDNMRDMIAKGRYKNVKNGK